MMVEPRTWTRQTIRKMRDPSPLAELLAPGRPQPQPPQEMIESVREHVFEVGAVWIECEVVDPPSSKGRTVDLRIPPEQVLAVLKLCREAAAAQRSKPERTST